MVSWKMPHGSDSVEFADILVTVEGIKVVRNKAISYGKVYFLTPHFTEYLLPYFLVVMVVGYRVYM